MRRTIRLLLIPLIPLAVSACGLTSAASHLFDEPVDQPADRAAQPTTMVEFSLATVDRDAVISAVLTEVSDAVERGERVIVKPLAGTATGSASALDRSPPAPAANDYATQADLDEWREDVVADAKVILDALESPPLGTTVDVAEAVEVGVTELESIAPDAATRLVLITSGYQRTTVDVGAAVVELPAPGDHPTSVWLVGIGDLDGVDQRIDRSAAHSAVGTAAAVCGQLAPRPCRVLQSLAATSGGS